MVLAAAWLAFAGVTCVIVVLAISRFTGVSLASVDEKQTHLFETADGKRAHPFGVGPTEESDTASDGQCPQCGDPTDMTYSYCQICNTRLPDSAD